MMAVQKATWQTRWAGKPSACSGSCGTKCKCNHSAATSSDVATHFWYWLLSSECSYFTAHRFSPQKSLTTPKYTTSFHHLYARVLARGDSNRVKCVLSTHNTISDWHRAPVLVAPSGPTQLHIHTYIHGSACLRNAHKAFPGCLLGASKPEFAKGREKRLRVTQEFVYLPSARQLSGWATDAYANNNKKYVQHTPVAVAHRL